MIGKNNQYLKKTKEGTKVETYSIKKFKIGTASVVIGASIFFGAGAIAQASEDVSKNTTIDNSKDESVTLGSAIFEKVEAKQVVKEVTKEEVTAGVAAKLGVKETEQESVKEPVKTLDKTQLSSFISEIEEKISSGVYANKTEESIANLVADLNAAKETLASATTQEKLTKAYQKLVVSVNSKLRNKPVEKKGTPVVDSTTIKETVGNKAENVKKKVEANSIENTGAKDQRTGKEIAKNTAFRAAVNQDPKVDFTFSIPAEKKIYIYNEEHFSLEIPVYSETGKIRFATIKQGSRQRFANVAGTDNDLDVEFGFTATVINRAETKGVTFEASQANPAKIVITGRPNDILKKHRDYTKKETQTLNVGTRYVQVVDDQGRENLKKGIDITDPGYFYLVLKAQSKKYALRSQPTDEKISVSSLTNPTAEDLQKIKDSIQLEYSQNNEDARFADKRGTLVEHPEDVIQSVSIVGNNIVVTFTDGSTKTKPVSEIVQKNIPPVVNLPYSNETNRNIYIYSGEETDLTFTATDESKIKDMKLRGSGTTTDSNVGSGLTVGKIVDSSVVTGEGSVSEDKKTATIKMTGTTGLSAGQKWTSVIVAKDDNSGESASFDGSIAETSNSAERQKTPGYVEFLVKNQTSKYDIKAPEGKVSVVDPSNPTTEEFERIKEKVKIEYSQTNDDANLASKRGQAVDNQATRISTITKDANGNLVVTYKDGSTDTKPLSEFTSLNKQPAIDAVNKAAEDKIAEINRNTNATAEEKEAAIQKVNADKTKALTAINDNSVTTKAALDNAKTSGTTAISNDNPVATKKDTAKAAIDTALREKEAAIDANNALTTEEKNAAKVDAQAKATAAKTAIDNAITNAAVDSAKTAGTTSVSSVTPTAVAKPAAKNAIDEALKAKEAQLNARTDLTDEEKKAAKADAQARATAAKVTIDNATTNATVDSAKTSGVTDVESVNPQASQKKTDAKNAVEDALAEKIKEIEANNDLTDEEKATAKQEVQDKATAAKEAINNARTNDAVTQAKENGTTEVNNVDPQPEAKNAAKKAVEDALAEKIKAIEANNDLTDEEKTAAKQDAQDKATAAKEAINNARTNDAVTQAKTDGTTEVNNVNPQPEAKTAAKKAVEDALAEKIKEIEANNDLTDEEKATAKQEAQAKATEAKNNIDAARTNAAVTQAKTNGTTEVTNVDPQPEAKNAAKKAVEDAVAEKIKEIDANNALTDEEKATAKQEAQDKATAAKEAINNARTNAAVIQAKTDGTTEVNNVDPQPEAKTVAKKAVEDALAEKIKAIEGNNDLTDEEKAAAKQEAQAKADTAKEAINNARTNAAVTQAKTDGTTEVNNVDPQPEAKTAAKKAVEDALAEKIKEIEGNNDLTDEEKATAKQDAQDKATAAKEAINNARTNDAVTQAKTDGTTEVNNVDPQPEAKTAAKKAVEDALAEKIKAIEANNDLTDEEKATAKQDAQDKATAAKEAINNARTNDAVTQAKTDGTTEVNNVDPQPEAKTAAKKAVEDKLAAQLKVIENTPDATDEEKKVAAEIAKSLEEAAKQAIDHVQTDVDVKKLQNDSETRIEKTVPLVEDKPNARKAIDEAAKTKKQAIDARIDLSERAKELLKAQVDKIVGQAKKDINNITKLAELDKIVESQKEVIKAVGVVNVPAKKVIVKDSTNLTDAEKEAVKKAIEEVNPGATVVDDKGNITVIMPDGSTVIISKDQLVKTEVEAKAKDGGDNINLNFDKVLVTDLNNITKEDKVKFQFMILGAITDVEEFDINSLNIEIDEEGNAKVTLPNGAELAVKVDKDGNTVIKSKDGKIELVVNFDAKGNATVVTNDGKVLAIPAEKIFREKAKDASTEDRINTPANRVLVTDKENLTAEELTMVKESVEAVNPGVTVVVDAKGNVTITTKDGKSAIISVDQLVKTLVDVVSENDGDNINLNFEKQEVADLTNLKDVEKAAARAKILSVNPNAVDVIFDAKGNATVVLKDGKAYTILSKDVFSQKVEVAPSEGNNEAVNAGADVDNNAQDVTSKLGQRLANTGTTETNTGLAGLGLGILGGLLAATRRRKNDKN